MLRLGDRDRVGVWFVVTFRVIVLYCTVLVDLRIIRRESGGDILSGSNFTFCCTLCNVKFRYCV